MNLIHRADDCIQPIFLTGKVKVAPDLLESNGVPGVLSNGKIQLSCRCIGSGADVEYQGNKIK